MRRSGFDPPVGGSGCHARAAVCAGWKEAGKEEPYGADKGLEKNQTVPGTEKVHAGQSGSQRHFGKSVHRQGGRVSGLLGTAAGIADGCG
nr:MAG TPA_asm: hypothetical protein [Caudoviricetes sp.]DAO45228.1 MAG TPA: hypothetical protein [Caudoviricetes sp.]